MTADQPPARLPFALPKDWAHTTAALRLNAQARSFLPAPWFVFSALAFVVLAFLIYGQSGPDDAYITYWPARTLAEHGRIWNYNGVRLEQSSSLSLVVVLAILYRLTPFSMPVVAFLTSLGFGIVTLWLAERVARRLDLRPSGAVVQVIATVACFGSWATSGMEMSLVAASGLLMILQLDRLPQSRCRVAGGPDRRVGGPVFCGIATGGASHRGRRRGCGGVVPAVCARHGRGRSR
jgi:hypothetical protein